MQLTSEPTEKEHVMELDPFEFDSILTRHYIIVKHNPQFHQRDTLVAKECNTTPCATQRVIRATITGVYTDARLVPADGIPWNIVTVE